jgi:hypothetical protein
MMPNFRTALFLIALLSIMVSLYLGAQYAKDWMVVDSCLDGGGSFDFENMVCDHSSNHPYVSYQQRHPGSLRLLLSGTLLAFSSFLIGKRLSVSRTRS